MPRPLIDSPFIFGIHEPGGEQHMLEAARPGWIVFTEVLGHDPEDRLGVDYSAYAERGLGIIARLNHGYEPDGTLPHSSLYEAYARRVANFVGTSRGCKIWVIGNEMNYAVERPGVKVDWSRHSSVREGPAGEADPMRRGLAIRFTAQPDSSREIRTTRGALISPGEVITPELYARCYRLCRDAIHRIPGHQDDLVLVGPVTPWNTQTIYPGNANGDWIQYFHDILALLGEKNCDGFALHAYTQGPEVSRIASPQKLAPPFQARHQEFRVYTDFLGAVPAAMRHLPVFLTEVGQAQPWPNRNSGWIQALYAEIDAWNRQPGAQTIRAAALYRWPRLDRWYIAGKAGVEEDFRQALLHDYRWQSEDPLEVVLPVTEEEVVQAAPTPAAAANASGPAPAAAAAAVAEPRTRRERRRQPPRPYAVEWLGEEFPARLLAGQILTVPVTIKNVGSLTWTWGGGNPVRLGYRYYRNRRPLPVPPTRDLRTDVPEDVAPGQTIVIEMHLALPEEPGNYTLELDFVHEGIAWFKEKGSTALTRWLTVEAPAPEAQQIDGRSSIQLPVRLFNDITARLPRSGAPYARRNLNQVKYIIVNHTGAHPQLSLDRIARAHIKRGYPGIAYDFVVDASGEIFKTTELEDVAQPDQVWSEQGVNICLTGNFHQDTPPLPQLDAAGRLCAWLAQNLGLTAEAIVGLGELLASDSPGETFYRGAAWKEVLRRQVRLHLAALGMGAADSTQLQSLETQISTLDGDNQRLRLQAEQERAEAIRLQQVLDRMQAELIDLRRQLESRPMVVEGGLRLNMLVDRLPRDPKRYVPRQPSDVEMLVIHHTAAPPETSLQDIATAHRADWPGMIYDFVIDGKGEIYQTQPLDQVADAAEPFVRKAINIAFAGDFSKGGEPAPAQIAAGGRLLAWLRQRYPQVLPSAIRGASEFAATVSPGREWNSGRAWKRELLASAGIIQASEEPSAALEELQSQVARLEVELDNARRETQAADEQRAALVAEKNQLRTELEAQSHAVQVFVVPKPPLRVIVEQLPKHPTLRYERRSLGQITHIAVHHTAAPPHMGPARIAELHIAADASRGKEPWPGIGYHFFVHEDGSIEQTNHLETASYHVFRHYGYTAGVVFAGSFMNGKIPSSAQLRSGAHLLAWLMQELRIPLARVWGHREFPDNMTVCPGSEWTQGNRWRDLLFERIEQIQKGTGLKPTRHYMLFWQREQSGLTGREDMVNALGYIARFRPTVGFSAEEARGAEYVTIVGGEAGVSRGVEQMLLQAGCKVERIAGRDSAETGLMFAELLRAGRRFQSFESDF
jgi:N-acetyl-anhydromuramyl-L-alanine amidase AmpD